MPELTSLPSNFRIISGGQSGADIAALDWAIAHYADHGGWCPKGRRSEDAPIAPHYLLSETPLSNYLQRTEWNVRDSDATVIFTLTDALDGGSKRTAQFADKLGRPWLHFRPSVHPKFLRQFLVRHRVTTLNVAGKRESSAPGIYRFVFDTLEQALAVGPSATAGG
jgi:Circularly permutated YpsA SLOG family